MPVKALHPCAQPGCPELVSKSRCPKHDAKRAYYAEHPRGSSTQQGYGEPWRKGIAQSTEADHIVPRARGGTDERDNLQGTCKRCHSRKTAREDGRWGR